VNVTGREIAAAQANQGGIDFAPETKAEIELVVLRRWISYQEAVELFPEPADPQAEAAANCFDRLAH
jgi:hypothetical protein